MDKTQLILVLQALISACNAQFNFQLPSKSDCDWKYDNVAWLEKDVCTDKLTYAADADARYLHLPQNYEFDSYINSTKKCATFDNWANDGIQPAFRYKNLCRSETVLISAVWYTPVGSHRQACVVHPSQQLYYTRCWHPKYNTGRNSFLRQHCEIGDYGSNRDFSCVPGAFIDREVVIFCPEIQRYFFYHASIPTSCTCSMCGCGLDKKIPLSFASLPKVV
ncbi:hypothetical protein CHS0354_002303 [Potamilus streckersoni]|uniref:Uncharacterized protein n=1 Tax=Potamilus streckersoni TaxID=2493646 RepID=A0AAE0SND3_9BIVA|nr:hypothetical protein CHS0354_002303 [Potamilus streckersoni]